MSPEILNRKGARTLKDIPQEVLDLLNKGKIESANLIEWLAIDHAVLIQNTFKAIGISNDIIKDIIQKAEAQKKPSAMNTVKLVGFELHQHFKGDKKHKAILKKLSEHQSDSVRCYAPFLISLNEKLSVQEKLKEAKFLISDKHFGIREVVWIALRPQIDKNLKPSIKFLSKWTKDKDENIRRFTTEATRPRGVWCKHIEALKEKPELALPILDPLKSDSSKYVQDSVGNWLNDASKSKPEFVIELCEKWTKESTTTETKKIVKRAMRTIVKSKA